MNVIVLVYASDLINCWLLFNRYYVRKIVSLIVYNLALSQIVILMKIRVFLITIVT